MKIQKINRGGGRVGGSGRGSGSGVGFGGSGVCVRRIEDIVKMQKKSGGGRVGEVGRGVGLGGGGVQNRCEQRSKN